MSYIDEEIDLRKWMGTKARIVREHTGGGHAEAVQDEFEIQELIENLEDAVWLDARDA